jgi:DNA-binding Lrp family transcriptional regulator
MRVTDNALVSALLCCSTIKQAAESVGLSEQAVYSRLRKVDFRTKLQNARTTQFQVISSKLEDANFKALDTLINILDDSEVSAGIKVKASQTLLDLSLKNREQIDVISRIENLEEMLKSQE